MTLGLSLLALLSATLVAGQRPSFAGTRPIGYPALETTTADILGNRFGESGGTTQRLPVEALGDKDLVDRLSKLPIDKQPFWFINWQALEANRNNPQSYPHRPSMFAQPAVPISDSAPNRNSGAVPNSNSGAANVANSNINTNSADNDPNLANRFSENTSDSTSSSHNVNIKPQNTNSGFSNSGSLNAQSAFSNGLQNRNPVKTNGASSSSVNDHVGNVNSGNQRHPGESHGHYIYFR